MIYIVIKMNQSGEIENSFSFRNSKQPVTKQQLINRIEKKYPEE